MQPACFTRHTLDSSSNDPTSSQQLFQLLTSNLYTSIYDEYRMLFGILAEVERSSKIGCHVCTLIFYSIILGVSGSETWRNLLGGLVSIRYEKRTIPSYFKLNAMDLWLLLSRYLINLCLDLRQVNSLGPS